MVVVSSSGDEQYDWAKEVQQFDQTKAGVKGLIDAGVQKLPKFFVHPPQSFTTPAPAKASTDLDLPTIDFQGGVAIDGERRRELVEEISKAAQDWGFFRIVNHGVPLETIDAILEGVKRFHEKPTEKKMHLYTSDSRQKVRFDSNGTLRENQPACWRDLLTCSFRDDVLDPELIPITCRKEVQEYVKCMIEVREVMAELFSEALGLTSDYLSNMEFMKGQSLACLYYPACPEPEKTLGTVKHSDTSVFTLLVQDSIGGLQIVHNNQWFDVPPVRGAFIVNIGDLMQMISNDKFISAEHRVVSQAVGPRISVACFFMPSSRAMEKPIAPIEEILSEENPALYREFMFTEYIEYYKRTGQGAVDALPHFRINNH